MTKISKAVGIIKKKAMTHDLTTITRDVATLTASMSREESPRLSKAATALSVGISLISVSKGIYEIYNKIKEPDTFTIKIHEGDVIFDLVEKWLIEATDVEKLSSIFTNSKVMTNTGDNLSSYVASGGVVKNAKVVIDYMFDGGIEQQMIIAGHTVKVSTVIPENYDANKHSRDINSYNSRSLSLSCQSHQARQDVIAEIQKQSQYLVNSRPSIYRATQWGDWRKKGVLSERSTESVILKDGQMDRIINHAKKFLENKESYLKAGIPYRTGIMLHGVPGSGKSSTAVALANAMNMSVYLISVSSLPNDDSLSECFSSVPENSIIVLEDIDTVSAVKDRDKDDTTGVTMSGILNVLDGIQSPEGVITFMTTNRPEVIADAVKRPGRVEIEEELGNIDSNQLRGLCEYFMGFVPGNLPEVVPEDGISSAEIVRIFRKYIPHFEDAGEEVVRFVVDKVLTNIEL